MQPKWIHLSYIPSPFPSWLYSQLDGPGVCLFVEEEAPVVSGLASFFFPRRSALKEGRRGRQHNKFLAFRVCVCLKERVKVF
jgi:hypothetical protein